MASEQEVELLPCPFCGSISKIIDYSSTSVECTGCPCSLDGAFSTPEAAITAWNTRQAAAAIPPSGEAVAQNDLPPHPEDFTHYALLRHHDRKRSCWIVVPEGQSLDFDEDDATRKWLHPYLGSEWHLFEFAILAALPAPVAIDEAVVEGLRDIKDAADSFRDESGDEVAGQVILRVDALLAALNPQPNGGA